MSAARRWLAVLTVAGVLASTASAPFPAAHAADTLTASFAGVPSAHDGVSPFSFNLVFSESPSISYAALRDDSFDVTGATVTGARRIGGRSDRWEITVAPDVASVTDAVADVSIELPAPLDCGDEGAVCTADDVKALSNTATATVAAPPPLTAEFEGMPATHDTSTEFSFRLRFSTAVTTSYRILGDTAFDVTGGEVSDARRVEGRSDLWQITVQPDAVGDDTVDDDITITLPTTEDCTDTDAVCTAALRPLSEPVTASVEGPLVEAEQSIEGGQRVTRGIPGDKEDEEEDRVGVRAVPDAPANLGFNSWAEQLAIFWDAVVSDPVVTGYEVEYREVGTTPWLESAHSGTGTTNAIMGLDDNTVYEVRVRARNGNTDSDLSSWSTIDAAMPVPNFSLGTVTPRGIWSDGTTAWVITTRGTTTARAFTLSDFTRSSGNDIPVESQNSANNSAWGICSDGTTTWVGEEHSTGVLYAYELNSSNEWRYQSSKNISGNDLTYPLGLWCDSSSLLVSQDEDEDREVWAYALPARTRNTAADITPHADNEQPRGTWANASTVWINDSGDHKLYAYARSNGARIEALDLDYSASSIGANQGRGIWSDGTHIWIVSGQRRIYKFALPQRGANTAPTADDGAVTTVENTAYTFDAGDFNFVDTDAGDELDKVKIVTLPTAGTLALDGNTVTVNQEVTKTDIDDDKLTFTPATDSTDSTSFTFKVNDGDDESASAYTMTVNVTAAVVTCAAPTYTGDLRQIWTGALTVGSFEAEGETFYGYNSTTDPVTGALMDNTVTVGGDDYPIDTVNVGSSGMFAGLLVFNFTAATAPALSVVRKLVLFACDRDFAMGKFDSQGNGIYTLAGSGLDWSSERPLDLYVAIDDTLPELMSAKVTGTTLVLTYHEPLDESNAVPASAFAVTVAGGTAAQPSSVAVDGATVTLTLANEVTAGQTVTLTYTKQAGTPRVRDVFTNEAAALTDQAVGNSTGNTAPTADDGAVTTVESTPYAFDAGDFNFADTDSGDTLEKVKIVTLPDAGTLALSGTAVTVNQEVTKADIDDDNLTFTPVVGANGSPYTTFTFKVNDGDDESASAYTMTVNVAAPSADLLWSATMTVGKTALSSGNGYFVEGGLESTDPLGGNNEGLLMPYGALTDDDFSYGDPPVDYVVKSVRWGTNLEEGSGSLSFVPDAALPAAAVSSLILQIGTNSFPLEDATVNKERRYKWTGAYQTITPPPRNSMVSVCLRTSTQVCSGAIVPDTTAPEFTGATVNGAFVEMTYSEDLDDTFATQPATTAFTVMVAGSPRTVTDAGVVNRLVSGVTKATVRLKLASTVAASEAVTVAYMKPATNPVRDVGGNEAVSLTAQDVVNNTDDADLVCGTPNPEGRTQIWTGTVTVESSFATLIQGFDEGPPVQGVLSDKTFTVGSNNYTIRGVTSQIGGSLYLGLTSNISPADKNALTLHVCADRSLGLGEANGFSSLTWSNTDIDWTPFTTRNLALSIGHATGAPTILGAAQVGATLRASTAEIADDDGKTKADNGDAGYAYTYQWVRENADGTSPVDISGATSSTYPVVAADVGKKLKVKVSFTDDRGNPESLTSEVTGVVIVAAATTVTIAADEPAITNALSHMDFTLTRTGDTSAALTVTITLAQTQQFLSRSNLGDRTAEFAADDTTADFRIRISQFRSLVTESGELTATIAPGTDYGVGTPGWATVAVKAAHPAVTGRIELDAYEVDEDVAGGKATVHLVAQMAAGFPAPNTTLQYALVTEVGTAVSPGDYEASSDLVNFQPSDWTEVAGRFQQSKAVEVTIINDDLVESNESLNLVLDRAASLPLVVAVRRLPNGDPCPVPDGETLAECISTLTILDDDVLPVLDTATVNGLTLVLTYDRELDGDSDPPAIQYSVMVDGEDGVAPASVNADGRTVTLTLGTAVTSGQSVTLNYAEPGTNPVQDIHGNTAPRLVDQAVHNVVGDTTAPELENAQVDGAVLVLTYNEALDPGSTPAVGDFGVQVTPSGGTASRRDVSTVDVSGSRVTLTLASAVLLSDSVAMAYVVPSSNPLQDVAGNDAAAFSGRSVGHVGTNLPMFPQATLTREITENSAANVNVGEVIPAATGGAEDAMLVYSMEGTDAASFNFDATTRQITTKTGVTYDYETTQSYSVTIRVSDGTASDTVTVTIDVKDLPTISIEPEQERVLLSDGRVLFEPSSDLELRGIGLEVPVVLTQDHVWVDLDPLSLAPAVEKFFDELTWSSYTPIFLRDAPVQGGDVTVTLQPGDDWELDPATSSATVEIVAADPLITVRAEQAAYSVAENSGTVTVTLIAETIVGAPEPITNTTVIAWAAAADEATGGGADFRDAGAAELKFIGGNFTEDLDGRWVSTTDVEVTVVDDDVWEFDEEFHIALSRFVEVDGFPAYMHPLIKLANADGSLCEDNASGVNCGATVTILSSDNAAPAFSSSPATRAVAENSPADTNVGAPVTATDANTGDGDALTYSLEGTDRASFVIDASTGQITTTTGVDYDFEVKPSYSVTVKATDRQDASATIAVTINLTDVDPEVNVCAAPDLAGREQVWTAEMTVGSSIGVFTSYGFRADSSPFGSLSDDDFQIGTTNYEVDQLFNTAGIAPFGDRLTFLVDNPVPDMGAVLHVCDESFRLADALLDQRFDGVSTYIWSNSGLDWSAVDMRNVYLSVTPPQLSSARVDGTQLELEFSRALDTGSVPSNSDFNVQVTPEGGVAARRSVTKVDISASTATLTLSSAVLPDDTVTVQYSGQALRDTTAIKVRAFDDFEQVDNDTPDTTAPLLESNTVSGSTLTLTYNEALDENSVPAPGAFVVNVAPTGGTAQRRNVTAVEVDGVIVRLMLVSPVAPGDTVTLVYTVPGSNPVQDQSGNDAAAIDITIELLADQTGRCNRDLQDRGLCDLGTATTLAPGVPLEAAVAKNNDVDWFRVELVEGKVYRVDMEGAPTGRGTLRDPYLRGMFAVFTGSDVLGYQADGRLDGGGEDIETIWYSLHGDCAAGERSPSTDCELFDEGTYYNDDGGVGYNARLYLRDFPTGAHYVEARGLGPATGTYTITLTEVTDDAEGARTLDLSTQTSAVIDFPGDTDAFTVDLTAATEYTITLRSQGWDGWSRIDIDTAHHNSAPGIRVDTPYDGSTGTYTITPATTGTHTLRIVGRNWGRHQRFATGDYTITITG